MSKNIVKILKEDESIYSSRIKRKGFKSKYRLVDLFSGAGGMSLGFSSKYGHAFVPVWANDFKSFCVNSYNTNFGDHCVIGDIVSILEENKIKIPEADVVIGGPPCQGFSLLNKNRLYDPRKTLWRPFLNVVKITRAKAFVMENVPQLLGSFEHGEIRGIAEEMGFKVWHGKLLAADFGVPQKRYRAFIIGCKFFDPSLIFPPRKTHYDPNATKPLLNEEYIPNSKPWRTVRNAIGDLPPPMGTQIRQEPPPLNLHFGRSPTARSVARYRAVPEEGMNRFDLQKRALHLTPQCWINKKSGGTDLFGRLWWDKPAFTIRTEFFKPEKGRYLHPEQNRPITHREAARFQSFPDDFVFKGSKIKIAIQIGNAVPPLLDSRIADIVYLMLTFK